MCSNERKEYLFYMWKENCCEKYFARTKPVIITEEWHSKEYLINLNEFWFLKLKQLKSY